MFVRQINIITKIFHQLKLLFGIKKHILITNENKISVNHRFASLHTFIEVSIAAEKG